MSSFIPDSTVALDEADQLLERTVKPGEFVNPQYVTLYTIARILILGFTAVVCAIRESNRD